MPLRAGIGSARPGRRLDIRRLVRDWSTMRPLVKVPFRKALRWPARLAVVWDDGPEMDPFARDIGYVVRALGTVCDRGGLLEIPLSRFDAVAESRTVGLPLLVLSGQGQLVRTALPSAKSRRMEDPFWNSDRARRLLANPLATFLDPCPGHRRGASALPVAHLVPWTRSPVRAPLEVEERLNAAGKLLDLVSPVRRITPTILRWARRHLGWAADAGTEWDAWFHQEMRPAWDCTEFADIADLRRRREALLRHPPGETFSRQLDVFLGDCSPLIQLESRLTVAWARGAATGLPEDCLRLCTSAVQRLRELAESGDLRAARGTGLAGWVRGLTDRLPVALRSAPELKSVLARGCALGAWLEGTPKVVWPEGIDAEAARAEWESLTRVRPMTWRVSVVDGQIGLTPLPTGLEPVEGGTELGRIRSEMPLIHWEHSGRRTTLRLPESGGVKLGRWSSGLILRTDLQVLSLEGFRRPTWARQLEQDRYGLRAEFEVGGVAFALRWIPPGTFWMGSPEEEPERYSDEGPRRQVTLTRGFWMGETPVTQDQWRAVVATMERDTSMKVLNPTPSRFQGPGTLPVEQVSWEDCVSFSGLLSVGMASAEADSPTFRLPTEAEWEYACRAGTTTRWSFGDDEAALEQHAWHDKNSDGKTHPVGMKRGNPWGLKDMHGGIMEWCSDWSGDYGEGQTVDPEGPAKGSLRVIRGGSWLDSARFCRSAYRLGLAPGSRRGNLGFRLVLAPRSVF
jgi:formylglycine-generating enzyme required for sulfatase activity